MNKSNKIWLNYLVGGIISGLLIWGLYLQVNKQLDKIGPSASWKTGNDVYLWACILLMPVNLGLEAWKWRLLAGSAQQLSYSKALQSLLAGIAFSVITPNRIGEYPGRILYLKKKNTFRLISVSILGIVAQMLTMFLFGLAGLIYYNFSFPGIFAIIALILCFLFTLGIAALYWSFETWIPLVEKIKWLRRFHIYGQLLKRFSAREQLTILIISIIRVSIYTAQYLILLRWMNINLPPVDGFLVSALFFWLITVIPSISLLELGERGQIALFLFHSFTDNTVGILAATIGVWAINLILPALAGSLLALRMRLIR